MSKYDLKSLNLPKLTGDSVKTFHKCRGKSGCERGFYARPA